MDAFLKYIRYRSERITVRVKKLGRRCGEASLHNLRVDIKKQRALYRLFHEADPDFPYQKSFHRLKKIFAHAGIVREIHRQTDLLQGESDVDAHFTRKYTRYLVNAYQLARNDFRIHARDAGIPTWEELEEAVRQAISQCNQPTLADYFQQLNARAHQIIGHITTSSNEEIHQLRKDIKDYEANRKISARYFGFDPGPFPGIQGDINALLDLLGLWHDYDRAWRRLQIDLAASYWSTPDRQAGKQLLLRWQRKSRYLKRKLKKLITNLPSQNTSK